MGNDLSHTVLQNPREVFSNPQAHHSQPAGGSSACNKLKILEGEMELDMAAVIMIWTCQVLPVEQT